MGALLLVASCGALGAAHLPARTPPAARLVVEVSGFANDRGTAGIALWNAPAGFPEDVTHAIATAWVRITRGTAEAAFGDLQPGTYALTAFHDENDNRRFDKRWFGLPKEAWGVSNDVRPLRAPRFDEASFEVSAADQTIRIHVE